MKIGLVLSGGGARGFAHIGALQALTEIGIKIDMISGVSAGAIVGAFFCAGYKPKEILDILIKSRYMAFNKIAWFKNGIFSMDNLKKTFENYFKKNNFNNLNIQLFVTATDIISNKSIVFSNGTIIDKVIASASIPVIFDIVKYKKYKLLDGGILDNLPVWPLINKCDKIIAIHVNPIKKLTNQLNVIDIIDRTIHMIMYKNVLINKELCNIFIEPNKLSNYRLFDLQKANEIYNIGYKEILLNKNNLLSIIEK